MKIHSIKGIAVRKRPRYKSGTPSLLAHNRLDREFTVDAPTRVWETDITYIRTWQGWLYLANKLFKTPTVVLKTKRSGNFSTGQADGCHVTPLGNIDPDNTDI